MENLDFKTTESDSKGKVFVGDDARFPLAEMTFSKAGSRLLIIDHTEVNESLKGLGVGRRMLDIVVNLARDQERKVIPLCPFAKSEFNKDPSIGDVLRK